MNQTIAVAGTGSSAASPDLAIVEIGVEVVARSFVAARTSAATEMGSVLAAMRGHGLEEANLTTTAYAINPEYDHRDGRRLRGYRVVNMVQARIRAIDTLGENIDAATAGSEHVVVRDLRFVHEDDSEVAAQARQAAWTDATAKAGQLAALAGVDLGPVVAIAEHRAHVGGAPARARAMEAAMASPIESGELAVTINIEVEFSIGNRAG